MDQVRNETCSETFPAIRVIQGRLVALAPSATSRPWITLIAGNEPNKPVCFGFAAFLYTQAARLSCKVQTEAKGRAVELQKALRFEYVGRHKLRKTLGVDFFKASCLYNYIVIHFLIISNQRMSFTNISSSTTHPSAKIFFALFNHCSLIFRMHKRINYTQLGKSMKTPSGMIAILNLHTPNLLPTSHILFWSWTTFSVECMGTACSSQVISHVYFLKPSW